MNMKQAGMILAFAALLVNAPRLVQIFLRVDGMTMGEWEAPILGLTGLAAGVVLSGGQMYIAHILPHIRDKYPSAKGWVLFLTLLTIWLSMLGFSIVLISPMLVAGIRVEPLMSTVLHDGAEWVWSIVAVTSVEVLAAGTMLVHAVLDEPIKKPKTGQRRGTTGREKHGGTDEIETEYSPYSSNGLDKKELKLSKIAEYYEQFPRATVREVAAGTGVPRSSVSNYVSELEGQGVLIRTEDGIKVVKPVARV